MEKQIFRSYIVWPIDVVVLYNNRTNSFRKREIVIRIRYPRTGVPDVFFRFYFRIAFDDVRRGVLLDDLHIQQCVRARRCNYYVFCIAFCIDWNAVKTRRRICSNENSKYRRGTTPRRSSFIGRACYVRLFFRSIPEIHAAVSNYRNEQNKKNRYLRKRSNVSPNEFYWRVQSFSKYRTLFEFFFFGIVYEFSSTSAGAHAGKNACPAVYVYSAVLILHAFRSIDEIKIYKIIVSIPNYPTDTRPLSYARKY